MYFDPMFIALFFLLYCVMAYKSFDTGRKHGVEEGVAGTFDYLEHNGVIKYHKDGTLKIPKTFMEKRIRSERL